MGLIGIKQGLYGGNIGVIYDMYKKMELLFRV